MPVTRSITGLALGLLLVAGCANGGSGDGGDGGGNGADNTTSPEDTGGKGKPVEVSEKFRPYGEGVPAITYDEKLVPKGAQADLTATDEGEDDGTEFALSVSGLQPDREYGAHIHTKPCGENPDDAGPHYQDKKDPKQPSTNPKYANDDNEVWLDFATNGDGEAKADTDVDWQPRDGEANSFVIHKEHTKTGKGEAGDAGDRLACMNVKL